MSSRRADDEIFETSDHEDDDHDGFGSKAKEEGSEEVDSDVETVRERDFFFFLARARVASRFFDLFRWEGEDMFEERI